MRTTMNRIIAVALIVLAMACVSSCKDKDDNSEPPQPVTPELSISPLHSNVVFSADGTVAMANGTMFRPEFTVTTNEASWNVNVTPAGSWLTATKQDNKFTLTATRNNSLTAPPPATVTVTGVTATAVTFTVTQAPFTPEPAELYVDGLAGGYIDFGYSPEYIRFGEDRNQVFTIELWAKFKDFVAPGAGASILSTILDASDYSRCGWFLNWWPGGLIRASFTGVLPHWLWEPQSNPFTDLNTWVHIAVVYDDNGVYGEAGTLMKLYINGGLEAVHFVQPDNWYNAADDPRFPQRSMVAFGRWGTDDVTGSLQGYIKHLRIWKSAKTPGEIQDLMNGTTVVTGQEGDLACAWAFNKTAPDEENIVDLTGRHSASLHGSYTWEIIE